MINETEVLIEFGREIQRAAKQVSKWFEPAVDRDEAVQEAMILVMSYAGFMPGRHHNVLAEWREITTSDDGPKGLLYRELVRDLCQLYRRRFQKKIKEYAVGVGIEEIYLEDVADPEDVINANLCIDIEEPRLRQAFPFLLMRFDGLTEVEMAKHAGVSVSTVRRHLKTEQAKACHDPYLSELMGVRVSDG